MSKNAIRRIVSVIIAAAMFLVLLPTGIATVSVGAKATSFTVRTTAPSDSNPYYIHNTKGGYNECMLIEGTSCLPNCVGYAWGRAYEAMGSRPNLCKGDAKTWWSYNINNRFYSYDSNPAPGSIACYDYDEHGHVLFIENVVGGEVYFSESEYGGVRFRYDHRSVAGMQSYRPGFQGYIHLGISPSYDPIGHADEIVGGDGEVFIRGWAFDYDDPGASLQLHVYIGGYADDPDAEVHTGIYADGDRQDINNSYSVPGNHGYKTYIKTNKTGGQYVCIYAINKGEGNNVLIGREWVSITSNNPIGHADEIVGGDGEVFIRGWAFDYNDPGASLGLNVYIGGPAGDDNAECHTGIIANGDRNDINSAYGISGNHGFKTYIQTDKVGGQYVYIYAVNKGEGNDSLIAKEWVNITHHSPIGHGDEIKGGDGEIFIRGWAFDPDEPGTSIQLHVYIGGSAGDPTSEPHTGIYANGDRQDINDSYGIPGDHGFKTSISTDKRGWQKVYIYGINIGEGSNIPHFAEAEVYINPPHTHSYTFAVTPPTCTEQGYTTHTCSCGDSYVDTYVDALGHQWDSGEITVAPTATKPGIITYTCTLCGETKMEIVPALGDRLKGDADGDGEITVSDALIALRIAAKLAPETPEMITICDTDGDGRITVSDALAILRVAAKLVASL